MGTWKAFGACCLAGALIFSAGLMSSKPADATPAPIALESPDDDDDDDEECFEWTYPKKDICGKLSGIIECKDEPSIELSDDEKKKEECQPTKGETCICE